MTKEPFKGRNKRIMIQKGYSPIYKRARTPEQKKCICENLCKLWCKTYDIRLGQLLSNTFGEQLFFVEDYDLLGGIEAEQQKSKQKRKL